MDNHDPFPLLLSDATALMGALKNIEFVLQKDICASDMLDEIEAIVKEAIHG